MPSVTFVPRKVAESMTSSGELMISIIHPGDTLPSLDHWPRLIRLIFDDIEPPSCGMKLFSVEEASFIIDKIDAIESDTIVHCAAGMSRSAAIAKWLSDHRGYDLWMHQKGIGTDRYYNKHVYKTMCAADGKDMASYYEDLERCDRMMV